jgi:hypothetical protein
MGAYLALSDPKATYWQYSFPAQIISVVGADFTFACGTLFIAKIAQPYEQSVAAALFQTITTLGINVGLAISTVAQVARMNSEARKLGVTVAADARVKDIPPPILLKGYRAAQYAAFAFGAFGEFISYGHLATSGYLTETLCRNGNRGDFLARYRYCWDEKYG